MRITIFTGAAKRHSYLIKILLNHDLFVIREDKKSFSYLNNKRLKKNKIILDYFQNVKNAENKVFNNSKFNYRKLKKSKKINYKELAEIKLKDIDQYLNSDLYIVYGSSYIKGDLLKFLIKKKCINIHMGISPYYKGSNCNFWALHDKNFHLVGATIHRLTNKIDGGPILFHSIAKRNKSSFIYSMSNVKAAITLLKKKIDHNEIFKIKPIKQKKNKNIKNSKNSDFNEYVLRDYPISIKKFKFKKNMLIRPNTIDEK